MGVASDGASELEGCGLKAAALLPLMALRKLYGIKSLLICRMAPLDTCTFSIPMSAPEIDCRPDSSVFISYSDPPSVVTLLGNVSGYSPRRMCAKSMPCASLEDMLALCITVCFSFSIRSKYRSFLLSGSAPGLAGKIEVSSCWKAALGGTRSVKGPRPNGGTSCSSCRSSGGAVPRKNVLAMTSPLVADCCSRKGLEARLWTMVLVDGDAGVI